jgi:hypothetical protein
VVAVCSSIMFVYKYQTGIWCHNPEEYNVKNLSGSKSVSECLVYQNTAFHQQHITSEVVTITVMNTETDILMRCQVTTSKNISFKSKGHYSKL